MTERPRRPASLRRRLVLWLLAFTAVVSVLVFAVGIQVHEHAEHAAWRSLLGSELAAIEEHAARDPGYRWQDSDTLRLYRLDSTTDLPGELRGLADGLQERLFRFVEAATVAEEGAIVVHRVSIGRIHGQRFLVARLGGLEIRHLLVEIGKTDVDLRIVGIVLKGAVEVEFGLLGIALAQILDTQIETSLGGGLEVGTHFTLGRILASVSGLCDTAWQRTERCHYDQCTDIHFLSIQWLRS